MNARSVAHSTLGRLEAGRIDVREGGRHRRFGPADAALRAEVEIHSPHVWRAMLRGSTGLAESYAAREWDSGQLVELFRIGALEAPRLDRLASRLAPLLRPLRSGASLARRNTPRRSRRNVAAHYDLGNDFFALFLDETMTYSCAYFPHPGASLREAQEAKLGRVCRRLELSAEDHLLEIGTGWGSLAIHAAGSVGCRVTTTTISREQHALARERVARAGLSDRVSVLLQDYRELEGRFDKLASIEMIEAVGWQYFDRYFERCSELLADDGLALIQAITIDDRAYEVEKASRTFINKHIFPGGCLPSLERIGRSLASRTDLTPVGLEDITPHYARTLHAWRERFLAAEDAASALGFDDSRRRMWDLYLAYCEAGFAERRISDVQLLLAKPGWRGGLPAPAPAATNGAAATEELALAGAL